MHGQMGKLSLAANYGYIDAKFESALTLNSPSNSSADPNGDIRVSPGNKVPGIPEHSLKLRMDYDFTEAVSVGTNIMYFSSQYARGDENNQDANGKLPGYTLVNLDARYQLNKKLMFFGRITNLFDKEYETLGVLGENFFNGPGRTFDAANVTGTHNVLEAFADARSFVHMSSASVYDLEATKRDISEDAPLARAYLSGYVRSKIAAEALVKRSRPDAVILRPHIVYGPGDNKILPRLLAFRRHVGAVFVPGNGRNRLSLTHVENLAAAVELALCARHSGVFNVADALQATVDDLLLQFHRAFQLRPRIVHVPMRAAWAAAGASEAFHKAVLKHRSPVLNRFVVAQIAYDFTLDCTRANRLLGYRPYPEYPEAIEALAGRISCVL